LARARASSRDYYRRNRTKELARAAAKDDRRLVEGIDDPRVREVFLLHRTLTREIFSRRTGRSALRTLTLEEADRGAPRRKGGGGRPKPPKPPKPPNRRRERRARCKYGHPLMGENVKVKPDGHRYCVPCQRARDAGRRRPSKQTEARRREERPPPWLCRKGHGSVDGWVKGRRCPACRRAATQSQNLRRREANLRRHQAEATAVGPLAGHMRPEWPDTGTGWARRVVVRQDARPAVVRAVALRRQQFVDASTMPVSAPVLLWRAPWEWGYRPARPGVGG
jgi:hypothetical protein